MRTSSDHKIAAVGPLRLLLEHPSPSSPHHCSASFPALSTLLVPSHSELSYFSRTQRNARLGQERFLRANMVNWQSPLEVAKDGGKSGGTRCPTPRDAT